jgi:hypothetical protein
MRNGGLALPGNRITSDIVLTLGFPLLGVYRRRLKHPS